MAEIKRQIESPAGTCSPLEAASLQPLPAQTGTRADTAAQSCGRAGQLDTREVVLRLIDYFKETA
jgi:hypothetical protein